MAALRRLLQAPRVQLGSIFLRPVSRLVLPAPALAARRAYHANFSDSHSPHHAAASFESERSLSIPVFREYLRRCRTASELLDVMSNNPFDAEMAAIAIPHLDRLAMPEERQYILRQEVFITMWKTLIQGSPNVHISKLGSALHSLWRLGLQDPDMLTILPPADEHNYVQIKVAMDKLVNAQITSQSKSNELLELVARTSLPFNNVHICTALNRLARLATTPEERKRIVRHPSFLRLIEMVKEAKGQDARFQATVVSALARLGYVKDKDAISRMVDNFVSDAHRGVARRYLNDPKVICSFLHGLAQTSYNRPDFIEVVHKLLMDSQSKLLSRFDEQGLCITIQSLAKLHADSSELMTLLVEAALPRLSQMNGQHLNMLAWGLSRRGYFRISWLKAIAEEIRRRPATLKPLELSGMCMCFARLRTFSQPTMDSLAHDIIRTRHLFKARSMCNVLFAFSALEYFPPKLFELLATRLSDLEATAPRENALLPIELIQIELTLQQLQNMKPELVQYFSPQLIERAHQASQAKNVSLAMPSRELIDLETYVLDSEGSESMTPIEEQGQDQEQEHEQEQSEERRDSAATTSPSSSA